MGTNAIIALINDYDGSEKVECKNIYLHYDGYLSHAGFILHTFYNTPEKVKALISLGYLSSIAPMLAPITTSHSIDYRHSEPNVTMSYHRDNDEELQIVEGIENIDDLDYIYNLKTEKWYVNNDDLSASNRLIAIDETALYKCYIKEGAIPTDIQKWLDDCYDICEVTYKKPNDYKRLTVGEIHKLNEENAKLILDKMKATNINN